MSDWLHPQDEELTMTPEPVKALAELRALSDRATPGPWKALIDNYGEDTWPGSMFITADPTEGQAALGRDFTQDDARFIVELVNAFRADPAALLGLVPRDELRVRLATAICSTWDMPDHEHEAFMQPDHCENGLRDADALIPFLNQDTGSAEPEPEWFGPKVPGIAFDVKDDGAAE